MLGSAARSGNGRVKSRRVGAEERRRCGVWKGEARFREKEDRARKSMAVRSGMRLGV